MSNGWFVPVDAAFIIVIVMLALSQRQAGLWVHRANLMLVWRLIPAGGAKLAEAGSILTCFSANGEE